MKKLAKLSPGRIFNFAGEKFVVMEQRDGAAFVLLAQSKESCPFNDKDNVENRNDYTCSTLKERIDKWVEALPRTSAEAAAILPFEVDLSCTDRGKSYGTITVKAAPLTLWQYGQFKELIPLNEEQIAASSGRTYLTNEHLRVYNELMFQAAQEKQVVFLDLYSVFADENGSLPAEASRDGVHLRSEYCKQWLSYLQTHTVSYDTLYPNGAPSVGSAGDQGETAEGSENP